MNASNEDLNWQAYNFYAVDAEEIWRKLVRCRTNYMIMEMDVKNISVESSLFGKLKVK